MRPCSTSERAPFPSLRDDLGVRCRDRAPRFRALVLRRRVEAASTPSSREPDHLLHAALHHERRRIRRARGQDARHRGNGVIAVRRVPRRAFAHAVTMLVIGIVASCAGVASAVLPRPVTRAFLDAGVPLNAVSIVVQEVAASRPLFALDPDRAMSAASVMKLVTTFAALDLLGPNYRWKTEAYLGGPLEHGTLDGDLILKGYG